MLHSKTLSPHRALRTLSFITAVIGVLSVSVLFGDASALPDATIAALPHGIFSSVGYLPHDTLAKLPNSLLMITLVSNFGTFILYALSCILCMIAYHKRADHSLIKHTLIPLFGVLANIGCMMFYLIGPFLGIGTAKEPLGALIIAALWGAYGAFYFLKSSKAKGRSVMLASKAQVS
jgi:hypothetical protein